MSEATAASKPLLAPLLARLGPRTRRRAQPRAMIALAGGGCALVVAGSLQLGIEGATGGDGFNRWPGLLLTLLVAASGVVVQHLAPRSPLATAGTVAVLLSVPAALTFATAEPQGVPPYSPEAILVLSAIAYGVAYLVGPGRGRPAYLGGAAVMAWAAVLQLTEQAFDWPFRVLGLFVFPIFPFAFDLQLASMSSSDGDVSFRAGGIDGFDPTTAGVVSLLVGFGFLALSRRLDHQRWTGAATPILVAALPALYAGVLLLARDLEPAGTGLVAVGVGLALLLHGASVGRRATTWIGALVVPAGVAAIVLDIVSSGGAIGVVLLLSGAGVVAAAHLWSQQHPEPDELAVDGPADRPRRREPLRAT